MYFLEFFFRHMSSKSNKHELLSGGVNDLSLMLSYVTIYWPQTVLDSLEIFFWVAAKPNTIPPICYCSGLMLLLFTSFIDPYLVESSRCRKWWIKHHDLSRIYIVKFWWNIFNVNFKRFFYPSLFSCSIMQFYIQKSFIFAIQK